MVKFDHDLIINKIRFCFLFFWQISDPKLSFSIDCLDLGYCINSNNHMKKGGDVYVVKSEK